VYRLVTELAPRVAQADRPAGIPAGDADRELRRQVHTAIKRVTDDIGERRQFNTAISAIMELVNALGAAKEDPGVSLAVLREAVEAVVVLLAPFTPHLSEELWRGALGRAESVHRQPWPEYSPDALVQDEVEIVVQVNGKVRDRISVPADCDEDRIREAAWQAPRVQEFVGGKSLVKAVVVPKRLVNFVVR